MQKALYMEGSQRDTERNSAMHEQLYMLSGADSPQDKEKIKTVENKAAKKGQLSSCIPHNSYWTMWIINVSTNDVLLPVFISLHPAHCFL